MSFVCGILMNMFSMSEIKSFYLLLKKLDLKKTMFIAQITAVERIGMTVPYYLGLIIRNPNNVNLSKYNELQY